MRRALLTCFALAACASESQHLCANGLSCPTGTTCAAKQLACISDACGNGLLDDGEVCDDGNIIDDDGCSATCQEVTGCGDGTTDTSLGELCDDGNTLSGDGCRGDCRKIEICGDNVLDVGEVCDDGNTESEVACPYGIATCTLCSANCDGETAGVGNVCGDGDRDAAHEQCDDGGVIDGDGCNATCQDTTGCGDHTTDGAIGEVCDDGNAISGDGCRGDCRKIEICGDNVLDVGEVCDDGNTVSEAACPYGVATCTLCSASCDSETAGVGNVCGDGDQDVEHEECDDSNAVTESSCPYGIATCTRCDAACRNIEVTGNVCGDGDRDLEHEECDDDNAVTETACAYGTVSCSICTAGCTVASVAGNVCGDGVVAPDYEFCDDGNPSCGSCNASCQIVTSAHAVGTIVVIKAADLVDGETFILNDGVVAITFEYNKSGGVSGTNTAVSITDGDSATTVRIKTRNAINNVVALKITASDGPGAMLWLTHDRATELGNQSVSETVADPDFGVSNMSGGEGGDCASGASCRSHNDCASGTCLGTGKCQ